jgi:predicted transcriptional regulator
MPDDARVITAKLPEELALELDQVAERIDRSKSWIVREAVSEWLAEEQRRYELTIEALREVDEGLTYSQHEVEEHLAARRKARSRTARAA